MAPPTSTVLFMAAALAVGACGTKPEWRRPGGIPEEWARDRWVCERETIVPYTKVVPTTGWRSSRVRVADDGEAACLRARGYERAPKESTPPG